jgi:riboflavin biosynthesis pyrimidine reductase
VRDAIDDYPWPESGSWWRAVMVMAPDGAIHGKDGRSGSISGPADRAVLFGIRALADAVLIGAQTFRAERYRPMVAKPEHATARAQAGLAEAPRLVMVSGSLDLPWDEDAFDQSAFTPIVVTRSGHDPELLAKARNRCELLESPGERIDLPWMRHQLAERGLHRVACEGGAVLLRSLEEAGLMDEWDVTLSHRLPGRDLHLVNSRTQDGFVFARFTREEQS